MTNLVSATLLHAPIKALPFFYTVPVEGEMTARLCLAQLPDEPTGPHGDCLRVALWCSGSVATIHAS